MNHSLFDSTRESACDNSIPLQGSSSHQPSPLAEINTLKRNHDETIEGEGDHLAPQTKIRKVGNGGNDNNNERQGAATLTAEDIITKISGGETLSSYSYKQIFDDVEPEKKLKQQLKDCSTFDNVSPSRMSEEMTLLDVSGISGMTDSTESLEEVHKTTSQVSQPSTCLNYDQFVQCLMDREVINLVTKKLQQKYREMKH